MAAGALTDTLQSVELADGVEIHLKVAGPAVRSVAWLIDFLVFLGILIGLNIVIALIAAGLGAEVSSGIMLLGLFLLLWFYNVIFEVGPKGATPGQRSMGLKVASVNGAPVRLPQSIIRNLLRVADFLPAFYLLGLITCLFTKKFQRLGDLVADTVVIYSGEKQKKKAEPPKVNAEPQAPAMPLSREEQAAVLQFIDRAPQWSDARKVELANVLEPLTHRQGMAGLSRLAGIGLWLRDRGRK